MTTKRQNEAEPPLITYLVQRGGQPDFQIQVPADYKLTFGAVNPGAKEGYNSRDFHCLRVWEGEKLRAVFCDVRGFRDLSLNFARKIETETGSASWKRDDSGSYEASEKRQLEQRYQRDEIEPF